MTTLIGTSLGRYHLLEQLGEGGMATVYKAFDTQLERDVAIKVILQQKQSSEKLLARFKREAKALAQLSHPNIVKVLDYGEHDGTPFLVMEYISGGTLKGKLGTPMSYTNAAALLAPIARALEFAHQRNIVHRDIKPANILLSETGTPMLSDFGIAKLLQEEETMDLTGTGVGVGTPEYMAPEQGLGRGVDHRADIYALGIVFYELITGRKPFKADTPMAVVIKQINDPLPRPKQFVSDVPEQVERVIFKALAKKPDDRFQEMGAFATVLEGLAQGRKVSVGKVARAHGDVLRRSPVLIALLVGLVMLGAGVLGGWIFANGAGGRSAIGQSTAATTTLKMIQMTATPLPSATVKPTNTVRAVPTVQFGTPTPLSTSEVIADTLVSYREDFDDARLPGWWIGDTATIKDGLLQMKGRSDWTGSGKNDALQENSSVLFLFRYSAGANFEIFTQAGKPGDWEIPSVRRWGIYGKPGNVFESNVYKGSTYVGGDWLTGNLQPAPDHWYFLLVQNRGGDEFYARIWDRDDPANYLEMSRAMGSGWEVDSWWMGMAANTGVLQVDSYQELLFQTSLVTDAFDDVRFDGSYNGSLWTCWNCTPPDIGQKDGAFQIALTTGSEATARDLISNESWTFDKLADVKGDLKLGEYSGSRHADAHLQIWADLKDYRWWTSCDVAAEADSPSRRTFFCHVNRYYPDNTTTGEYSTPQIIVTSTDWHTARIEIDPDTFKLRFYLDDTLIGSRAPLDAEQLKQTLLTPQAGIWTEGNTSILAQIDNFSIGAR